MKDQSFGIVPIRRKDSRLLYLMIQHHAGHWAFPKGHAQNGETDIEAARRELREETGISDVTLLPELSLQETYFFKRNQQTVTKTVRYFAGLVKDCPILIQAAEIRDYQWVDYDRAMELITFSESRRILTETHRFVANHSVQVNSLFEQIEA